MADFAVERVTGTMRRNIIFGLDNTVINQRLNNKAIQSQTTPLTLWYAQAFMPPMKHKFHHHKRAP